MSDISPSPQPFAEWLSDALQEAIKVVVGTHRKPPRRLKRECQSSCCARVSSSAPSLRPVPMLAVSWTRRCSRVMWSNAPGMARASTCAMGAC